MISVMMPVYNAGEFLRHSIESVLRQTITDFELIIVNDGSTDNSEEIILSYSDARIKYFKKENGGQASARNLALEHVKGEFIVFQDADDISVPNRFETLLRHFTSEETAFVHSDMLLIDKNNVPIGYWQSRQIEKSKLLRYLLKVGTPFNNPSIMVRRKIIEPYRYDLSLKIGEDTDMVSKFALNCRSVYVPEPLLLYRRHANNISKQSDYEVLYLHVRKFLERYSFEDLFPELNWQQREESELKAKALLSLFLLRRGMVLDGKKCLNEVIADYEKIGDPELEKFLLGIGSLIIGKLQEALNVLVSCKRDHIIENYIGEVYAYAGDYKRAYEHFQNALLKLPGYHEALENLKSIGGAKGFHLIDPSWSKFLKDR